MKNRLLLILFFPLFCTAQQFADKEYYLVDSLNLRELSVPDKEVINNFLKKFHFNLT